MARKPLLIFLFAIVGLGCPNKPISKTDSPKPTALTSRTDTIVCEPQLEKFGKTSKGFFLGSGAVKAVSYSFLDIHDYEMDSSDRGQLLAIMPNYDQYLSKKDPNPKVILTRLQTQRLLSIINDPGNYSNTAAFCYNPRNCFCFYNSKNEIIGWYELCFECARIQSIPEFRLCKKGGLNDRGLKKFREFCTSATITVGKL